MAELPLAYVEWPGLNTYFDAYMTLGHGIMPSTCILTCPAQNNPIAAFGDLVWRSGRTIIRFPACRIDKIEGTIDPTRGPIWQITILDRRWRWAFNTVEGWYNVRQSNLAIRNGTEKSTHELAKLCLDAMGEKNYDLSLMPKESELGRGKPRIADRPGTRKQAAAARVAFEFKPEVHWDPPVNAAQALHDLCETVACRIVPFFRNGAFDAVRIVPVGYGNALPPTNLEFHQGIDTAELPDKVGIKLGPTIIDVHLRLKPVISSDLFTALSNNPDSILNFNQNARSIFHRYPQPEEAAYPVYDPQSPPSPYYLWHSLPTILFDRLQQQVNWWRWVPTPQELPPAYRPDEQTNWTSWTREMQSKLVEEAFRYWQIMLPFTVPDIGEFTAHDQYALETERAETFEDPRTGVIARSPAYVYGSYNVSFDGNHDNVGLNSEAYWGNVQNPVVPNEPTILQAPFQIDQENRLVKFQHRMFRNETPPDLYERRGRNIYSDTEIWEPLGILDRNVSEDWQAEGQGVRIQPWGPAALILVTAIRIVGPTRSQVRYEVVKPIDEVLFPDKKKKKETTPKGKKKPPKPFIAWETHEDLQLRGKVNYEPSPNDSADDRPDWIVPVSLEYYNENDCKDDAGYYMKAMVQKYQTKLPQRARYPGLQPIQLDGAIQQVTYSSHNSEGAYTVACRDSEWAYGTALSYPQRLQMVELFSFRKAVKDNDNARIAEMRRRIFVPSSTGGQFGMRPPGG